MANKNLIELLQKPFDCNEISFKVINFTADHKKGLVAAYVNNSAIQKRLDEVFTPFGWEVSFRDWKNGKAQLCTISVYDGEKWIKKEDGASDTDFEPIKGGLSDSMKRAARMLGIGRYLASDTLFKNAWVNLDGKKISQNDLIRLKNEYNQYLSGKKAVNKASATIQYEDKNSTVSSLKTNATQQPIQPKAQPMQSNSQSDKSTAPASLLQVIKNLIQQTNSNINSIIAHYNVSKLEDLNVQQANNALILLSQKL